MMTVLPNLIFLALLTIAVAYACINFGKIIKNIRLGKAENRYDRPFERIKAMVLVAFGQKKNVRPSGSRDPSFIYLYRISDRKY